MLSPEDSQPAHDPLASSTSPAEEDPRLLETVVEATLRLTDERESSVATVREAIVEVGQKYRVDRELSPPIVLDLVRSVIARELPGLVAQPAWAVLSAQIAENILNDPVASQRLTRLWQLVLERMS